MKVEFIRPWPPYQIGDVVELSDTFLEANQMFSRGLVKKYEATAKQVSAPPKNKAVSAPDKTK